MTSQNPNFSLPKGFQKSARPSNVTQSQAKINSRQNSETSKDFVGTSGKNTLSKTIDQAPNDKIKVEENNNKVTADAIKSLIVSPKFVPQLSVSDKTTFVPFSSILMNEQSSLLEKTKVPQGDPSPLLHTLQKKLAFNKRQESEFRKTAREEVLNSYRNLVHLIDEEDKKHKQMPKVKVLPSKRYQDNFDVGKLNGNKNELQTEDIQEALNAPKLELHLLNLKNRLSPYDDRQFIGYWYPNKDEDCWKPEARESATFITYNSLGYLYGGMAQNLRNDIVVLDASTF